MQNGLTCPMAAAKCSAVLPVVGSMALGSLPAIPSSVSTFSLWPSLAASASFAPILELFADRRGGGGPPPLSLAAGPLEPVLAPAPILQGAQVTPRRGAALTVPLQ